MRIVSLLPSTTELVAALNLEDHPFERNKWKLLSDLH